MASHPLDAALLQALNDGSTGPVVVPGEPPDEYNSIEELGEAMEALFWTQRRLEVDDARAGWERKKGRPEKRLQLAGRPGAPAAQRDGLLAVAVNVSPPGGCLEKFPKATARFFNMAVLIAPLAAPHRACGYAICDGAAKREVKLRLLPATLATVRAACGAGAGAGAWDLVATPVADLQFARTEFHGLTSFRALPRALFEAPGALRCYLQPSRTPHPTRAAVAAWLAAPSFDAAPFNAEQRQALGMAATTPHGLILIQGPPGTGKSHLLTHGLIPRAVGAGERVLVACVSNEAVDGLLLKLLRTGLLPKASLARLGCRSNVKPEVVDQELFVDADARVFDAAAPPQQLVDARVVFTTLYQLSKADAQHAACWRFDRLVVDEAGCVPEAALRAALAACAGSLRAVELVGDHKQLPPIVPDGLLARSAKHGRSCLERAIDCCAAPARAQGRVAAVMLREQHRMAPSIRALVSQVSYGRGALRDAASVAARSAAGAAGGLLALAAGSPLRARALVAMDLSYGEAQIDPNTRSRKNSAEADAVVAVFHALRDAHVAGALGLPPSEEGEPEADFARRVAVVSTFVAHRRLVEARLLGVPEEAVAEVASTPGAQAIGPEPPGAPGVPTVSTVHSSQGGERDIVIFTPCHFSSFTANVRLLNVALSRAKHLLVIVGQVSAHAADEARRCDASGDCPWGLIREHMEQAGGLYPAANAAEVDAMMQRCLAGAAAPRAAGEATPARGRGGGVSAGVGEAAASEDGLPELERAEWRGRPAPAAEDREDDRTATRRKLF